MNAEKTRLMTFRAIDRCVSGPVIILSPHESWKRTCHVISDLYLSRTGGMAEKRRAGEFPDWRPHWHPSRPQPHHQRGAPVWLGQLHMPGQQHCGQETQRHSHCHRLWYGSPPSAVFARCRTSQCNATLFTLCLRSLCLFSRIPRQVIKRPISMFLWKRCLPLFQWMYYSKSQFSASHLKSMCTLWKEISHCVLISFKRSVAY